MLWDTVYGCLLVYSILCIHTQQHVTRSQKWGLTFETGSKSLDLVGSALAQILRPKFCSRCSMACHASYIMICLQTLCNSHTWRGDGKLRQEVFFFLRWVMHMPISLARLSSKYMTGWWFGTFAIFPYIGNNHLNRLICFRGAETTNQMRYAQNYGRSCFCPLVFGKCTTHIVQRMGGPLQSDNLVSEFVEKLAGDHR